MYRETNSKRDEILAETGSKTTGLSACRSHHFGALRVLRGNVPTFRAVARLARSLARDFPGFASKFSALRGPVSVRIFAVSVLCKETHLLPTETGSTIAIISISTIASG